MTYLLSQVEVQRDFIFVVKHLYFQNDWLARETINHLTQDFGKRCDASYKFPLANKQNNIYVTINMLPILSH